MKKNMIVVVALIFGATWTRFAALPDQETWIVVQADGKERAAFLPAAQPYTEGGPAVSVYLMDRKDVRTKDGLVVTGFEFIGWKEASTNRVVVFTLVPREGAPNTYMPNGDEKNLRRQDFATYTVGAEELRRVEEMKALGIEPMVLRTAMRKANRQ